MTLCERCVDDSHHIVELDIEKTTVAPVVRQLDDAEFSKFVMAERRHLHVVGHIELHDVLCKCLRRVGLAIVFKSLRHGAKVLVEDGIVAVEPVGGDFLVVVVGNGIHVACKFSFESVMVDVRFAHYVVWICRFGDNAVFADDNRIVVEITALSKIHLAVQHHVLDGAVDVILPYDEGFGEVGRVLVAIVHHFGFDE